MHEFGSMQSHDKMMRAPLAAFAACALVLCALAGCKAGPASNACMMIHVTDLKLIRHDHRFATVILINHRPVELTFDTGAEGNILTTAAAVRLGLDINTSGGAIGEGIGGEVRTGRVHTQTVQLGRLNGGKMTFQTFPASQVDDGSDGLLGMPFLTTYDMDLDFQANRVGLFKALGDCATPQAALPQPLYEVDLMADPNDLRPAVIVSISGKKLRAVIDTGSFHTIIFRDAARRAGLGHADSLAALALRGVGPRSVKGDVRISAPVTVGDLTIANMPIIVADQRHGSDADMMLGYDFITRVHLWISTSSKSVIMQYPPAASPPLPP